MVKKSTKSKSKRTTLRHKHKVIKKVREHHRKQRKEQRKAPKKGSQKSVFKDPGIPAQWPFRDQFVQEMKYEQARIQQQILQNKTEKKRKRQEESQNNNEMEKVRLDALRQNTHFEANQKKSKISQEEEFKTKQIQQDTTRKAYQRDFKRVIDLSDVIVQVLDSRDPLSYRNCKIEDYIKKNHPEKKLVLLLNKIDLIPQDNVAQWLEYFRKECPTVPFKCSTQKQAHNLKFGQSFKHQKGKPQPDGEASTNGVSSNLDDTGGNINSNSNSNSNTKQADPVGQEELLQLLKNYTRNLNIKTSVTVGIIGFPNVGKSSLINSLVRNKAAHVGNAPGVTKAIQEIHLDKTIRLLDSPGVFYEPKNLPNDALPNNQDSEPSASQIQDQQIQNQLKTQRIEAIEEPLECMEAIMKRVSKKTLQSIYLLGEYKDTMDFVVQIAQKKGKLKKGGIVDTTATIKLILKDWNDGKIPYHTQPPIQQKSQIAQISDMVISKDV